jgi:hypothetical protein
MFFRAMAAAADAANVFRHDYADASLAGRRIVRGFSFLGGWLKESCRPTRLLLLLS